MYDCRCGQCDTPLDATPATGTAEGKGHQTMISREEAEEMEELNALAEEFVRYWTTDRTPDGCGMCGGIPHSTTCYVGRMDALLKDSTSASSSPRVEELERQVMEEENAADMHRRINRDVAAALQLPAGASWANLGQHVEALRAELERLRAEQGWRPIETAPEDGTPILIDFGRTGIHRVFWSEQPYGEGIGAWCVTDNKFDDHPLRGYIDEEIAGWQPLPTSPESPKATAGAGWQPIETAPKEGTDILVTGCNGTSRVIPVHWVPAFSEADYEIREGWYYGSIRIADPTHWQPLPTPPMREITLRAEVLREIGQK